MVLILREVPCKLKSSLHNALVKVGSLSDIIDVGIPCSLKMLEMNNWATLAAV